MKIFIIICNQNEEYSILDTAFKTYEEAKICIAIQKTQFPTTEFNIKPLNLLEEKIN